MLFLFCFCFTEMRILKLNFPIWDRFESECNLINLHQPKSCMTPNNRKLCVRARHITIIDQRSCQDSKLKWLFNLICSSRFLRCFWWSDTQRYSAHDCEFKKLEFDMCMRDLASNNSKVIENKPTIETFQWLINERNWQILLTSKHLSL